MPGRRKQSAPRSTTGRAAQRSTSFAALSAGGYMVLCGALCLCFPGIPPECRGLAGAQARAAAVASERLRTADWERSTLASGLPGGMCTCRKGLGPVLREHRSTKCVLTYTRAGGPDDGASEARAAKRLSMSGDRDVRSPLHWQPPAAAPSGSARLSPAAPLRRRCTAAAS